MNFAFVIHQIIELETFRFESQSSTTELSWDLYTKGGENVVEKY